jgi:hypothetical protein
VFMVVFIFMFTSVIPLYFFTCLCSFLHNSQI